MHEAVQFFYNIDGNELITQYNRPIKLFGTFVCIINVQK